MLAFRGASGFHIAQVVTGVYLTTAGFEIKPVTLRFLVDKAGNYFYQSILVFNGQ